MSPSISPCWNVGCSVVHAASAAVILGVQWSFHVQNELFCFGSFFIFLLLSWSCLSFGEEVWNNCPIVTEYSMIMCSWNSIVSVLTTFHHLMKLWEDLKAAVNYGQRDANSERNMILWPLKISSRFSTGVCNIYNYKFMVRFAIPEVVIFLYKTF